MDFMKVFDQTVREIKREVNLKVLKVPEIEQKPAAGTAQQVDLFGESLIGDYLETPANAATINGSGLDNKSSDVDLFADAEFVSAAPKVVSEGNSQTPVNVDLFAAQPAASCAAASAATDFFASTDPTVLPEPKTNSSRPSDVTIADPFAAVSLDNFDGSNIFGGFTSRTDQPSQETTENTLKNVATYNARIKSSQESKAPAKKDGFQVKFGLWADPLSRGLIDLNISAPKKVNLADIGIVGDLSGGTDEKQKRQKGSPTSYYMGTSMGMGSGLGATCFNPTTDDFFSSYTSSQHQFGGFRK